MMLKDCPAIQFSTKWCRTHWTWLRYIFNIDKYTGIVEVINWDASQMLSELQNSSSNGHRYLADALSKYMKLGSNSSNWGQSKNIYLLNYVNGPDFINIIGATSPATLFFSNANKLDYVNNIYFGEDKPFDNEYQPLYKRDFNLLYPFSFFELLYQTLHVYFQKLKLI